MPHSCLEEPLSTDDIALLKQMRDSGEIDEEQYEALRRHVLWGTPLPELLEGDLPAGIPEPEVPGTEPTSAPESTSGPARRFTPNLPSATPRHTPDEPADVAPHKPFQPSRPRSMPLPPQDRPAARDVPPARRPPPARPAPEQGPPPRQQKPSRQQGPAPVRPSPQAPVQRQTPPPPAGTVPAPRPERTPARRAWPYVVAAAVLVVLVVGGTAGWWFFLRADDGVKPADYAAAVCPDIGSWRSDILAAGDKLGQDLDQADGRNDQKQIAKRYYSDAAARTDQLIPELEKIQGPDGSDNEEYVSELADSARTADDRFHNLAAQVDELEPAGKASFKAALQILTGHPEGPLQAVTALVAQGRPPADIDDAFTAESSCQNLR